MTTVHLDKLPAAARARYVKLGRQYGSHDTLAQADQTLGALARRGHVLAPFGFVTEDAAKLEAARDGLIAAGVAREDKRDGIKSTNLAYVNALAQAKQARLHARSVLESVAEHLRDEDGHDDALATLATVLHQTRSAGDDAELLATQLGKLEHALEDSKIKPTAKNRGGPEVHRELGVRAAALREASQHKGGTEGTGASTEVLDLYDGVIVTQSRAARRAARAAARKLGQPALAAEFELTKLYRSHGGAAGASAPASEPTEPSAQSAQAVEVRDGAAGKKA